MWRLVQAAQAGAALSQLTRRRRQVQQPVALVLRMTAGSKAGRQGEVSVFGERGDWLDSLFTIGREEPTAEKVVRAAASAAAKQGADRDGKKGPTQRGSGDAGVDESDWRRDQVIEGRKGWH